MSPIYYIRVVPIYAMCKDAVIFVLKAAGFIYLFNLHNQIEGVETSLRGKIKIKRGFMKFVKVRQTIKIYIIRGICTYI